jgi:hypothetical protein
LEKPSPKIRAGGVTQGKGPEFKFKPQYNKKTNKPSTKMWEEKKRIKGIG